MLLSKAKAGDVLSVNKALGVALDTGAIAGWLVSFCHIVGCSSTAAHAV